MSKSLPCFAALVVALGTFVSVQAVPLTTSNPVPIPSPNPGIPTDLVSPVLTPVSGGFTGTWSAPAQADWIGTFSAVGPIPSSTTNPPGTTVYDFTSLPLGFLPVGSIFRIGDLDGGSGSSEKYTFSGTSPSGPLGAFLDEPFGVDDNIGATATPDEMPSVILTGGTYVFDGSTESAPGNPGIAFAMETNQPLFTLTVIRASSNANFTIMAPPVPEPATGVLLGAGGVCLLRRRR